MIYDDASWHYEGDFPKDLDKAAGATHIGMFLTWALLNDLGSSRHTEDAADQLAKLRDREMTPGRYLIEVCDEQLTDADLDESGNAFAAAYADLTSGTYIDDYDAHLGLGLPSIYQVEDSWETYDRIAPTLDKRYREWSKG